MKYDDYIELQNLLFKFMQTFDDKNWLEMSDCLAKTIYCDYSSFRKEKPGRMSQTRYIQQRMKRLENLKTQHNVSNVLIRSSGEYAEIMCNYAIYRFHPKFNGSKKEYFHSYGKYVFECKRKNQTWLIYSITQSLLVNDGDSKLYYDNLQ